MKVGAVACKQGEGAELAVGRAHLHTTQCRLHLGLLCAQLHARLCSITCVPFPIGMRCTPPLALFVLVALLGPLLATWSHPLGHVCRPQTNHTSHTPHPRATLVVKPPMQAVRSLRDASSWCQGKTSPSPSTNMHTQASTHMHTHSARRLRRCPLRCHTHAHSPCPQDLSTLTLTLTLTLCAHAPSGAQAHAQCTLHTHPARRR